MAKRKEFKGGINESQSMFSFGLTDLYFCILPATDIIISNYEGFSVAGRCVAHLSSMARGTGLSLSHQSINKSVVQSLEHSWVPSPEWTHSM